MKNFVSLGFALNPSSKFIHVSYSDDLVRDNSQCVMNLINSSPYQSLFPEVKILGRSPSKWKTTQNGQFLATSSGGQITGFGAGDVVDLDKKPSENEFSGFAGAIVIDDPLKPDDAFSDKIRNSINLHFETTIRNRINSPDTPIIIIMQRLSEQDLCGYLHGIEPDTWQTIKLPAIYTDKNGNEVSMWKEKYSLDDLHKLREINPWVFETQYMQNPQPLEGLMYSNGFRTYENIPFTKTRIVKNYTDTADLGADYLCSITYVETDIGNYLLDVLYTQAPMEETETQVAQMLSKYNVEEAIIEANNGGRSFARKVEEIMRTMGNTKTRFKTFHQTQNKASRIFLNSSDVQNMCYMPVGWQNIWAKFATALLGYMKIGQNAHDDAPDALTGTVEFRKKVKKTSLIGLF